MNRFLRAVFLGMAALLGAGFVLCACYLHAAGLPMVHAKTLWGMLAGVLFLCVAGCFFTVRTKFKIFLLLFALFLVETLLQTLSWFGVLPAVNTKERMPWGRVYWTGEGLGNSIRNRYGWYFPEFNLERTNRVAVIGDSFVEAVEVHRTRNMGALLRDQLREQPQLTVMALGNHGTGPAHYLEVLKYAQRHFSIKEAVIVIYLGNDITDCSPRLQFHNPAEFIYYTLATNGALNLDSSGEETRAVYARTIETAHRPAWLFLPRMFVSHCMSIQLPLSVQRAMVVKKRTQRDAERRSGADAQLARLGLKAAPFALNQEPEAREGMTIMKSLLDRAEEFARTHGIKLRIVSVPFFPPDFYGQSDAAWTARLAGYDFLAPERELAAWAAARNISFLALGEHMRTSQLTTKDIRAFYLSNGSGHFSEAGHRFTAEAMKSAFFFRETREN